jgi:DNA polymerase
LEAHEEAANKSKLIKLTGATATQLSSNQQFAELLRQRGVEPPVKISPTTGEATYALSKSDLEFQALAENPMVSDLIRARLAVKSTISESRAYRLIAHSQPTLPVLLNYCGAHTHRWSAGDKINLQNLPAERQGRSGNLRKAIEAPPGYAIVVVDSSQIEARTNAWAAGETNLLEAFRENRDIYSETASELFGYSCNKKDNKSERQVGKVCELGLGYGMGWKKFAQTVRAGMMGPAVDISDDFAQRAVNLYRNKRAAIVRLWKALDDALPRMLMGHEGYVGQWNYYGNRILIQNELFIHYPNLTADEGEYGLTNFRYDSRNGWVHLYGGKLCENLIQSTARTVVAFQALEIAKRYPIVSLVHDEVLYLAPIEEADDALAFGIECLSTPPDFCPELPVAAEGGWATNYSK